MGAASSRDRRLQEAPLPDQERYFGLENFGNTCYANSVLQGLYQCQPFRQRLLELAGRGSGRRDDTVPNSLGSLFAEIAGQKKKTGVVAPKRFIQKIKQDWEQYRSYDEHQDAHELLLDLINAVSEQLEAEEKARGDLVSLPQQQNGAPTGPSQPTPRTWVHDLFQGREVHETQCLGCETVTRSEEPFFNLSLPVGQNSSLTHCLAQLTAVSTLQGEEKFFCNECGTYQEAQQRTRLSVLPPVLLVHFKRFKTTTHMDRDGYVRMTRSKLMYRVVFPFTLKVGATSSVEGPNGSDALYSLFAVIVHVGSGMDHGHYVAYVKSGGVWLLYEDDNVEPVPESYVSFVYGLPSEVSNAHGHGYILMYQRQADSDEPAEAATDTESDRSTSQR
mmetsp:Transcript_9479/g.28514  ORF Transcript_9479/g.28514 Transcript_9479/m.28514 type:complete len:389 (-) Transcript_9479:354-1520(-)